MENLNDNKIPSMDELKEAIKIAVRNAVKELFKINENFYYLVLITTGAADFLYLSAGSTEGLEKILKQYVEKYGYNPNNPTLKPSLKWSYADTPYNGFGYEKYFKDVESLFSLRPQMSDFDDLDLEEDIIDEKCSEEYNLRLKAMELALKELDEEDVFERKGKRKHLLINVSPDYINTTMLLRLNDAEALKEILTDGGPFIEEEG